MRMLKELLVLFIVTLLLNDVTARAITGNDFYDIDNLHVIEEPSDDTYDSWNEYTYWRIRDTRTRARRSRVYGRAFRDRDYSSRVTEFEDSEVWIYRPPRRSSKISVEYEICFDSAASKICYQVNTAKDYFAEDSYDSLARMFADDDLHLQEDQIDESLADPADESYGSEDIEFSYDIYSDGRSTLWAKYQPTRSFPRPFQPPSSIRPSKSVPLDPPPRSAERLRAGPTKRPAYNRPPNPTLTRISWFIFWFYIALVTALLLRTKFIQMRIKQRARERLLASLRPPRLRIQPTRPQHEPVATPSPSSSTQPLLYHTPRDDLAFSPSSVTSDTFTIPPSYEDVLREQESFN
ncbi:hypothetical protein RSOLAG22IIIB_08001 [Rhizoctonia solani]|uniref:Uncharacterized protein n=1 Tax=Rhizoctonia solani TaxID=456999 RepID=A0A0K6FR01_9AGAM|nr:hypothetical protein RSOLAG22IIIB_08001 [Rhizoctonia solani]